MKRILSVLVLAVMLSASAAGAEGLTPEMTQSLYSGMVGHVAFALPGAPQVLHDEDFEGYWTGSVQLVGNASGGEEFQFRKGDISAWIDGMLKEKPSLGKYNTQANALLNFASFFINTYDGQIANLKRWQKNNFLYVSFTYTYADTPGVAYRCKAILEGTTAVCLMGAVCEDLDAAMDKLSAVTNEEARAFAARTPETVTLGILSADFPIKAFVHEFDAFSIAACFAADFSYLAVQYVPVSIENNLKGDKLKQSLIKLAKSHVLPAVSGENVYDAELSFPAEDTALLVFSTINTHLYVEEYGQHWLCRLYVGPRGVYYVYAAETDTGKAFMNSLTLLQASNRT
jgi:hypothetical protein